ncbi:hypothetical protein J7M07_02985, partial [bacterium]|nr:hypothetical protein [bacterium]
MDENLDKPEVLIRFFREREKELECLYRIEEILKEPEADLESVYFNIISVIPSGWQFPEFCQAEIRIESKNYQLPG